MTRYKDENYQKNWYKKQTKDADWYAKRKKYARDYYLKKKAERELFVMKALISAVQTDPDPEKLVKHFEVKERK